MGQFHFTMNLFKFSTKYRSRLRDFCEVMLQSLEPIGLASEVGGKYNADQRKNKAIKYELFTFARRVTYVAANAVTKSPSPSVKSWPFPPGKPTLDSSC